MAPLQPLVHEDLADAAPLDRDGLLLIEVVPQPVERPAAEGQAEALRVGQRRGDDLGALLGGVGVWAPGAGPIPQPVEALLVEAMDPRVDGGPRDAQFLGHLAGPSPIGEGQEDPGPLDEPGLGRARGREPFEGRALLGGEFAERDFGGDHGCTSLRSKATPFLRQPNRVSSLAGCTIKWFIRQVP
jgi:hypothetical protein